jgi:hydrogenase maturation protein HypF
MQAWKKRTGTFTTSSAGRLLDAAAALVLGLQTATFEGQGPMMLESIAAPGSPALELPLTSDPKGVLRVDWAPLLSMLADETLSASTRSGILHESLARSLAHQAMTLRRSHEFGAVGLTGGVFQNKRLCERTAALLEAEGIAVLQPALVPSNDGGLAFGQIIEFIHKNDAEAG